MLRIFATTRFFEIFARDPKKWGRQTMSDLITMYDKITIPGYSGVSFQL
jgi:hypothetical protein